MFSNAIFCLKYSQQFLFQNSKVKYMNPKCISNYFNWLIHPFIHPFSAVYPVPGCVYRCCLELLLYTAGKN